MYCATRQIPDPDPDRNRDVLAENVVLSMMKAHNFLQEQHLRLFKNYGITAQQYNVLRILFVRGENGLCNSDISALMVTRVPDMTRLIDRMERVGLLKRIRSEDDRRMVAIYLLDKGRDLCQRIDKPLLDSQFKCMNKLTEDEQKQLQILLDKLLE